MAGEPRGPMLFSPPLVVGPAGDGAMSESIVVVGAGHCAGQLAARLRAEGFEGGISLVGEEPQLPYQRPPLSKAYLAGAAELDRVLLRPRDFYQEASIEVLLDTRVTGIDRDAREVTLSDDRQLAYEHLVLACGSTVRRLNVPGTDLDGVHYLRTLADCEAIRHRCAADTRVVIVGGGYIGLEVAAVANQLGASVTVLETEPRLMARVVAPAVSAFYLAMHRDKGVDVRTEVKVTGFEGEGNVSSVRCEDGSRVEADVVVVGVGILPRVDLAESAGLEVDNGIVVDEFGATSDPQVWAAGDCTSHPSALYDRRVRLESVHNAMTQAKVVAANLCGKSVAYDEAPWFWSDQYDAKLQIVGLAEGADQQVVRGDPGSGAFTVFHLADGVVRAADTVNGMRDHLVCRKLVGNRSRGTPERLADESVALKDIADAPG